VATTAIDLARRAERKRVGEMLASLAGIDPKDLPTWVKDRIDLRTNVAEWPLKSFNVRTFGAYGAVRKNAQQGACGSKDPLGEATALDLASTQAERDAIIAKRYPCTHWGADLSAPAGAKVFAPKDGWILYDGPATDAPFKGYGPWVVLIAHADAGSSMWQRIKQWVTGPLLDVLDFPETSVSVTYSLISHLANKPGPGAHVKLPGDIWKSLSPPVITRGTRSSAHWGGLRTRDTQGRITNNGSAMTSSSDAYDDPTSTGGSRANRRVFAGEEIGLVSSANHIHWEIRNAPLAGVEGRFDPIEWARQGYGLMLPSGAQVAPSPSGGGGGGILLLLALLFLSDKRGRR
jgi:murein DD-endopeptidase MepM/ murein hydrolase activator NlpD